MLRQYAIILGLLLLPFLLQAQKGNPVPDLSAYKTIEDKMNALADACDSLSLIEAYAAQRTVAVYGLTLIPERDFDNLSLFNAYIGGSYMAGSKDSAILFMEQSLLYARKGNNTRRMCIALERLLSLYNYTSGNVSKRDKTAGELQAIIDTTQSDDIKSRSYNALAGYYGIRGLYETQLKYQLANLEVKAKLIGKGKFSAADSANYGVAFIAVGQTYLHMKQPAKAKGYTLRGRSYVYAYDRGLIHYFRDMVDIELQLEQPVWARVYYDSLTGMQAGPSYVSGKWYGRIVMDLYFADYYIARKRADSALIYVNRANQLAPEYADEFLMPEINQTTGTVYAFRKEYNKALPLLLSAEASFGDQSLDLYVSLLQTIAQCYGGLGRWQDAYRYYDKYVPLRDSLYQESAKQSLANAEAKYQNKDKQQQIELQQVQLAYGAKQRFWLIAGLSLLGLVALLLVVIYRNKRRTAKVLDENNKELSRLNHDLEEANQTKAKLFGIISHDLRSPINQVYQFLKLQQLAPDRLDAAQKNALSQKIQSATGSLLETMEDLLLWSKTQMNQFTTSMQEVYVDEAMLECLQLLQLNIEAKQLVIVNNIPEDTAVVSDPYFLHTIVRNLLQNAIKASPEKGTIEIGFADDQLTISNNGGHFSQQQYQQTLASKEPEQSLSGLGLRLVDELSRKIDARVVFADANSDVTLVQMTFPAA